ncbi:MAG: glycerate dehydrogenase [marine bacterium B5-7]|nr:MAG: glycerate dehydrogenase [marine bacterium B5-7]
MSYDERAVFLDRDSVDRNDLDCRAFAEELPGLESFGATSPADTIERVGDARIVITNKVRVDANVLAHCSQVELIVIAATGANNIDLEATAARGITVCNARNYATSSLAQHVFALILSLSRNLPAYVDATRAGRWNQSPFFCLLDHPIADLTDQTLGIIGHGVLGSAVAELGKAFCMNVLISEHRDRQPRQGRVAFEELLQQSDVISLHCPLTPETTHLIGAAELRAMKSHAILINTARGGIVDEKALLDALVDGEIGAAGIDVLETEPPDGSSPLLTVSRSDLLITPHNAWASRRARQALIDQMTEIIAAWRSGQPINTVT